MTQSLKWYTIPVEKRSWGSGPWNDEPDKMQYGDEDTGLLCLIVRNPGLGNLCGYVGVPPEHPWHGKGYSETIPIPEGLLDRKVDERTAVIPLLCNTTNIEKGEVSIDLALGVHGGITFSDKCRESNDSSVGICHLTEEGEEDNIWWFGFDCGHCDDLCPGINSRLPSHLHLLSVYRTIEYVQNEIRGLAKQLASIPAADPLLLTHEKPVG